MYLLLAGTILDKFIPAFSWMLIHSLWQGLFLAIIAAAVLMLNKRSSAARRYNLALVLFVAFTGICAFTFTWEWNHISSQTIVPPFANAIGANVLALFSGNMYSVKQLTKAFTGYFSANAPLIVMIWLVFFLFKSVKMIACMVYNQQIRNRQIYEPSAFWADAVVKFSEKLQIKKTVRLLQSGYIKMPVVIGHLKPIILLPVGLMAGLPTEQVEAILLHELAHIRRNDYFINFLQNIAEAVFFFNPGLLWISSVLREERENCCDDIALAQTQNKRGFVEALISFKEHELYGSSYATAFPGKKNYLLRRVSRIMDSKYEALGFGEKMLFFGGIVVLCVVITTATVARIKDYAVNRVLPENKIVAHTKLPAALVAAKPDAKNPNLVMNHRVTMNHSRLVLYSKKMTISMPGIAEKKEPVAAIIIVPVPPVPAVIAMIKQPLTEKQQTELDRQQGARDQIEAKKDQDEARQDQIQAQRDQDQARKDQAQALLDQVQAKKDQEDAKRYQAQAKKDQEQAKKQQKLDLDQQKQTRYQFLKDQQQAKNDEEKTMKKSNVSIQE